MRLTVRWGATPYEAGATKQRPCSDHPLSRRVAKARCVRSIDARTTCAFEVALHDSFAGPRDRCEACPRHRLDGTARPQANRRSTEILRPAERAVVGPTSMTDGPTPKCRRRSS